MKTVDEYIDVPERDTDKPFSMSIEGVHTISGRGTVVTGRIDSGKLKIGEDIEIVGFRDTVKTTCTGVEMFQKELPDGGQAGDNVGVLLRGIEKKMLREVRYYLNRIQLKHIMNLKLRFLF